MESRPMCELFGVSSMEPVRVNEMLQEFISHSDIHWNGWGISQLFDNFASMEKEPVQASKSAYLKERLKYRMDVKDMIAHIRLATVGTMEYENCHPFMQHDHTKRVWVLAHNGTIFDCPRLEKYRSVQGGTTDSERILDYLVDEINQAQEKRERDLTFTERFELLERLICEISLHNKLNLLLYDGEYIYVFTNYKDTLFVYQTDQTAYFATQPLSQDAWENLPFLTLCAYRKGARVKTGTLTGHEYIQNEDDLKYMFVQYSGL